jgi:hypothetical protein
MNRAPNQPLTPALSPYEGKRENVSLVLEQANALRPRNGGVHDNIVPRKLGLIWLLVLLITKAAISDAQGLRFEVKRAVQGAGEDGRVFVIISRANSPEPRMLITSTDVNAPVTLARDVTNFAAGMSATLDRNCYSFPIKSISDLPAGEYYVQALFDFNRDLRLPDAPGNMFSSVTKIHATADQTEPVKLDLDHVIPPEQLPAETAQVKFVKIQSKMLSEFFGRPMYLRAGIILPRDYDKETNRNYPLWVRIGGYGTRYSTVSRLAADSREFKPVWQAENSPRFILLQLDGAGPFGDPYYVNSENNGPYGDALVKELIPYVESHFRAVGNGHSRVLSGVSTGGWVSLALQIFYPDFFNGAWSSCPDPVDFRAFELVNLYSETNAYRNVYGNERPSERDKNNDVLLTMRREVGMENLLGRGNSYILSGQQWGSWNAAYSPRGANGLPAPIWDPETGEINHALAEHWKKYDLRLVLEKDWKTLGPKLAGKLHIASGEADQYFLNNAMHLLDQSLTRAEPPFKGKIVYGPGKRHGWMDLSFKEMLEEMRAATDEAKQ